jgi:hypothetical protein
MQVLVDKWKLEGDERKMTKWQIALIAVLGSLLVVFAIGFVLCTFIF